MLSLVWAHTLEFFAVNRTPTRPPEMVRGLKFRIRKEEGLYHICNKGADQLGSYCADDLHHCFSHMLKAGFLMMRLISVYMLTLCEPLRYV